MSSLKFPNLSKIFNPNRMPSDDEILAERKRSEEARIINLHPVAQLEVRILQFFKKHQDEEYSLAEIPPLLNIIKDALNYPINYIEKSMAVSRTTNGRVSGIFEKGLYTPDEFLHGLIRSIGPMSGFDSNECISGRVLGLWVWEHLSLDIWTEIPVNGYIPSYVPDELTQFYQSELNKKSPIVLM